jgi:transcriptional regulator with XRE-family HTH domain
MPNVDAGAKAWELELAGRIGAVHVRRKALNLTAQQLAERTKNLGYPITRVAISKIEGNMRTGKIDVADLLVLAAALDLPTISLLLGTHRNSRSRRFNGDAGPIWRAARSPNSPRNWTGLTVP